MEWEDVPENNKALMIAVCGEILDQGEEAKKLWQVYKYEVTTQYGVPTISFPNWLDQREEE